MKEKNLQPRLLYPARISFRFDGEIKTFTDKGTPIRLTADFSAETLQARRQWHDILKVMKGKNQQPRLLY